MIGYNLAKLLIRFDLHRHLLAHYQDPRHMEPLAQAMPRIFDGRLDFQALTDHSHDFWRLGISFEKYLAAYHYAKLPKGKEHFLGMELNIIRKRRGGFEIDFDTIGDPAGKMDINQIVRSLDFVILSVHEYSYNKEKKPVYLELKDAAEYRNCAIEGMKGSSLLREIKPGIQIILGHPGKYRESRIELTEEHARDISSALVDHRVYPEINAGCILQGGEDNVLLNQKIILEMYISMMLADGKVPLVSFGYDNHRLDATPTIEFNSIDIRGIDSAAVWCDRKVILELEAANEIARKKEKKARKTSGRIPVQRGTEPDTPEDSPGKP